MSSHLSRFEARASGVRVGQGLTGQISSSQCLSGAWKFGHLRSPVETRIGRNLRAGVQTTTPVSLFGFGSKSKTTESMSYICVDCGYIYTGPDFTKESNSYKCPMCTSPKKR